MSGMTRDWVVAEGPCEGGCSGGILSQQSPEDIKKIFPILKKYNRDATTIIWLYQVKPVEVVRCNDMFAEDAVTITGKETKDQKIYFAIVPKHLVAPHLQWVYIQIG